MSDMSMGTQLLANVQFTLWATLASQSSMSTTTALLAVQLSISPIKLLLVDKQIVYLL